jgi:tetratricopeptide (TPR) repeat protein
MPRRYLFGPVTPHDAGRLFSRRRESGSCLAFATAEGADLVIGPRETWESLTGRLPDGWQPDFIVLTPAYATVPACLWTAPVPLVGLAADWDLLWHAHRRLAACDLILADTVGAEVFQRAGFTQARPANLCGCPREYLGDHQPDDGRPIDILFVGNLNPAVQQERLRWLGRLARLGRRWRVALHTGVPDTAYRELLGQARIVFNRSRHGACNRRAFEAAAAGALLFQGTGNREVPSYFADRQECVLYDDGNLEALLDHYLEHEDERQALAEAARARVRHYSFEELWEGVLERVEEEWPALVQRAATRQPLAPHDDLLGRCLQALSSRRAEDRTLVADLRGVLEREPQSASLHNARGLAVTRAAAERTPSPATAAEAAKHFRRAVLCDPGHLLAQLNLAEALLAAGQSDAAARQARHALGLLRRGVSGNPAWLREAHFPPGFDTFRVEWERAGWQNAGRPADEARAKGDLLRWRLHVLLAQQTGSLAHAYEAVLARPDLTPGRAALGHALLGSGEPAEAVVHSRQALADNPFDRGAARTLSHALAALGAAEDRQALIEERRLLARAAPALIPVETWFAEPGPLTAPGAAPATGSGEAEEGRGAAVTGPTPTVPRRVSLTMIVKNEEANLPACLASVADLVDDIVIADTGSTDRTKEVAARYGARVFDFPWCDSFAAARNEALRHATGDWVLWLDADDRLDDEARRRLRDLFAGLGEEMAAYAMKVRSVLNGAGSAARLLDQVRLFPRRPQVRWRYRVHEQILPAVRRLGGEIRWADVVIQHTGYQDAATRRGKLERNLRLLRLDHDDHAEDAFILFNLGWTTLDLGDAAAALPHLRRSLERSAPDSSIVRKLHVLILQTHRQLGQRDQALAAAEEGRKQYPDDPELLFEAAQLRREHGDLPGADALLRHLLELPGGNYFASVDAGLRGYRARQALAEVSRELGRGAEAEAHWQAVLQERPDFVPAWRGLAEVYLSARRWAELEQAAQALEGESLGTEASVLRARGHLVREDFGTARRLLEAASAAEPAALGPRVLLSHALLREHQDLAAAETTLRDILTLAPDHAEARHNLALLLRRQGRTPEAVPNEG